VYLKVFYENSSCCQLQMIQKNPTEKKDNSLYKGEKFFRKWLCKIRNISLSYFVIGNCYFESHKYGFVGVFLHCC
jgi:hypothetical protein